MPPHRFLNAIYAWSVSRIPPDKREEWDMMLTAPLPGQTRRQVQQDQTNYIDDFIALRSGA